MDAESVYMEYGYVDGLLDVVEIVLDTKADSELDTISPCPLVGEELVE